MIAPRPGVSALAFLLALGAEIAGAGGVRAEVAGMAEDCRSISLIDAATSRAVRGAEDIEVVPGTDFALVSAYDRWALEDAIDVGAERLPQGALYRLDLTAAFAEEAPLRVEDLTAAFKTAHDFHPHGISILEMEDAHRVFVVNHAYEREDDGTSAGWRYRPAVEVFDLSDGRLKHRRSLENALVCRPNNLVALGPTNLLVTNDRGHCGRFGAWLEDILPLRRANLVHLAWREDANDDARATLFAEGLRFANGIAADGERIFVAESRDDRVRVFRRSDVLANRTADPVTSLALSAGPDNLTWWTDGHLVSAVHPRLLRLGFYTKRWFGVETAHSRVVAVDVTDGSVSMLYDDPEGRLISAASGAVVEAGRLVIGSPFDAGLVVCRLPDPSAAPDVGP